MLLFDGLQDVGLLILRIFIGWIFIYHGWPKVIGGKKMAADMGKPQMGWFMIFLGIAETLGGLAAIAGFLTQPANIGFILVMLGAIGLKAFQMKVPFSSHDKGGWEFDFIILGAAIALVLLGAGNYSVDALIGFWP